MDHARQLEQSTLHRVKSLVVCRLRPDAQHAGSSADFIQSWGWGR